MSTYTLSTETGNRYDIEFEINEAIKSGKTVTVNNQNVGNRTTSPASAWMNGSLSIAFPARTTRGTNPQYFRNGATVKVEVAA